MKRYATLETTIVEATAAYAAEVRAGAFPELEHSFTRKTPRKIAKLY